MKRFAHRGRAVMAGMVAAALLMTAAACAQGQERFSVSFENTPITAVLEDFKRFDADFAYTLASSAESRVVTVALVDVTLEEALQLVLGQVNLGHVKQDGVYTIQEQADERVAMVRGMPQYGSPVFAVKSAAPAAAPATAQATAEARGRGMADGRSDLPIRMLQVKYGNPALLAELFGGYAIYGDQAGMMGGTTGTTGGIGGQRGTQRGAAGTARPGTTGRGVGIGGRGGGYGAGRGGSSGYGRAYGG